MFQAHEAFIVNKSVIYIKKNNKIYNKYTYIRERGYILQVDNADFNVTLYFSRGIIG